jgi:anaerobic ribonucleoside-triphosphate reductase
MTRKGPACPHRRHSAMPCEVYSRIVGYLRPVRCWHDGKRQEFAERRTFRAQPPH